MVIRSLADPPARLGKNTGTEEEPARPGRTVYCVPSAGTGAHGFLVPFARSSLRRNLRVVQLPGREDRLGEPCLEDLPRMAELIAAAIATQVAEEGGDYALFGHSFGAMVMFETVQVLERMRVPAPALLAVAACAPPIFPSLVRFERMEPVEMVKALRDLGGADFSGPRGGEMATLVFPSLRADCLALTRYIESPGQKAVACPILAMGGTQDTAVPMGKIALWRDHTESAFMTREFAGGHFFPVESDLPLRAVVDWNP
ncbi:MAG: thioesterase II family protein [Pseudonocardiaceae bacterium]